jgi:hypothetical protein
MSGDLPTLFIGAIGVIFIVVVCALIGLAWYSRGEVVRILVSRQIPCFPRLKPSRPLRVRISKFVVQNLSSDVVKIFDETIFDGVDEKNKPKLASGISDELAVAWTKIKSDPSRFTIWCYRFKRAWRTPDGIRGVWVYAFSLFSLEEMAQKYGRHSLLRGVFSYPPLYVHDPPSKDAWVQMRIAEAKAKGAKGITTEMVKKFSDGYRYVGKDRWISLIFHPTMLTVTREAELIDRTNGFGSLFTVAVHSLKVHATEFAEYLVLKNSADNLREVKRTLEYEIHKLADELGSESAHVRSLEHAIKLLRTPMKVNPDNEPYPSPAFVVPIPEDKGAVSGLKKAINKISVFELLVKGM